MSSQNPVFIPGPTNIPESLRKACDMPTIDHRSPLFGKILHPAREGVRKVLKSNVAEIFIFSATGTGGWEAALYRAVGGNYSSQVLCHCPRRHARPWPAGASGLPARWSL